MSETQNNGDVYVKTDPESAELPGRVFQAEIDVINKRRSTFNIDHVYNNDSLRPQAQLGLQGLALSGGGIRSSTFNLGVIQALERCNLINNFDYLSTVSGGGYIGSCLSSYWTGFADDEESTGNATTASLPRFPFRHKAGEPETHAFRHLRDHSNYLKPARPFAGLRLYGLFLRGLLINALIILPLLLFLAAGTVLIAKKNIVDALRTKQFEYVVDHKNLEKQRQLLKLTPGDYQTLTFSLEPYLNWALHDNDVDILLSGLPNIEDAPFPGAEKIGNGDWLLKNLRGHRSEIQLTLPTSQPFKVTITAWESDNHFKGLTTSWSYWLRKKMPRLFDALQTPPIQLTAPLQATATDDKNIYTLNLAKYIGWKKYVLLSGLPKNSYSETGNFLSDGRWLFSSANVDDLNIEMYIPELREDIRVDVRAWQSVYNTEWYGTTGEEKTKIIISPQERDDLTQQKIDALTALDHNSYVNHTETTTTGGKTNRYLRVSNLPGIFNDLTSHPDAKQLSKSNNEWVFINNSIPSFIELLHKVVLSRHTPTEPLELMYWQSGKDTNIYDPVSHLFRSTFSVTKWMLLVYGAMLAFYPLLQILTRIFGLKPWKLRDLLTRYICGASLAIVLVIAFLELQPLAIYLLYSLKKAFSFAGIFGGIDKGLAILGTLLASGGGLVAARSVHAGAKLTAKISIYAMGIIGPAVLWLFYLNLCGWILSSEHVPKMFADAEGYVIWVFLGLGIVIYLISRRFYNINRTSYHVFYRDRLSKAFLIKKDHQTSKLLHNDEQSLRELNPRLGPYHILNTTLNIADTSEANLKGRKAEFFSFGREYVGSRITGYVRTAKYEELDNEMGLGTAMSISAAAAAPNMGRETNKSLTFIMGLLNIRLGYWARNPLYLGSLFKKNFLQKISRRIWPDHVGPFYLFREMIGWLDERSSFINLSDGGHLENMGLYELVRRRCKYIIVCDAEADKNITCHGFSDAIRMVLIDMGIKIEIDLDDIYRKEEMKDDTLTVRGKSHCAVGTIYYGNSPEERGYLLYIKSSISTKHAPYILDYLARHPDFPHETTADQFFDEAQFEAYRALGYEIGEQVMDQLAGCQEMTREEIENIESNPKEWQQQALLHWSMVVKAAKAT